MKLRLLSAVCLTLLLAPEAQAHVRLTFPPARYAPPVGPDDSMNVKFGPCGVAGDSRTTDATRITTFQPGETIMVAFTETIEHPGFFRITFDDDGQDGFVPPPTSSAMVSDTPVFPVLADNIPAVGGGDYLQAVTLPTTPCANCTIQVIQVMSEADTWSAADDTDIYFQCADIVISGAGGGGGSGGTGGAGGTGGSGGGGTGSGAGGGGTGGAGGGGTTGSAGSTATSGAGGGAGTGGSGGTPPVAVVPPPEEGGCSLRGTSSRAGGALLLLGLLGALARRRRRSL